MKREPGFYWVIWEGDDHWQVAEWSGYYWFLTGYEYDQKDKHFTKIDERRIERPTAS